MSSDQYITPEEHNLIDFHVEKIIPSMSEKEKKYATYLILASWAGFTIILDQASKESPVIHEYLSALIPLLSPDDLNKAIKIDTSSNSDNQKYVNLKYLVYYAANFYANCGNYDGEVKTKFIPLLSKESLCELTPPSIQHLLNDCIDDMYSLEDGNISLGFSPKGITSYYSPRTITEEEVNKVNEVIRASKIELENTKIIRDDKKHRYNVLLPSIQIDNEGKQIGEIDIKLTPESNSEKWPVYLTKGRYSEILKKVNYFLNLAKENALNDLEKEMITKLISSYDTGSCADHVKYSELWAKDVDSPVESYHGFIERYRDPNGKRGDFEGFVGFVDPKESRILHNLVKSSESLFSLLPLLPEYQNKTFKPPSFNSINILSYTASFLPGAIILPNYHEIRTNIGFKNMYLENIINLSNAKKSNFYFFEDDDAETICKHYENAGHIILSNHELLGHGSGKLLYEKDVSNGKVRDLLDPKKFVSTYYEEGQDAASTFGGMYQHIEECRADASAVYLSFFDEVLDIYEINKDKNYRKSLSLTIVLLVINHALKSLSSYSEELHKWGSAHRAARFAILKACIKWGNGCISFEKRGEGFKIIIDKNKYENIKEAIKKLLIHLNYYKSTNKAKEGIEFFNDLVSMDEKFLEARKMLLEKRRFIWPAVGAIVEVVDKEKGEYNLTSQVNGEKATILDALHYNLKNIQAANQ